MLMVPNVDLTLASSLIYILLHLHIYSNTYALNKPKLYSKARMNSKCLFSDLPLFSTTTKNFKQCYSESKLTIVRYGKRNVNSERKM